MNVRLSDVLTLLYGFTIACSFGSITVRLVSKVLGDINDPPSTLIQKSTDDISFAAKLGKVINRSGYFFAIVFIFFWLTPSEDTMTDPIFTLLFSADIQWRILVMIEVFGLCLILSAIDLFLSQVASHIGWMFETFLFKRYSPKLQPSQNFDLPITQEKS